VERVCLCDTIAPSRLKEVTKIFAYFAAVVLLGALLAPPLFWSLRALEPWALANRLLEWSPDEHGEIHIHGVLSPLMVADFQKVFHRAVMVAAVLLIWPAWLWMGGRSLKRLGLTPDLRWQSHLVRGFLIGGGLVAVMAAVYAGLKFYHFKEKLPWLALPQVALSAAVVACLEEWLFRGAIMGLFLRALRPIPALAWTSGIFAILHFLRPGDDAASGPVTWSSAFQLLPKMFQGFSDPTMLLAGFATLFVLGWLLGYARLRTGALWMSIGIHAGVVFVKMGFAKFTKRDQLHLPWVGPELQIGVVPVVILLVGLFLVWRRMEYEELLPNPKRPG
jgi:membrane protease YdiL (CAAX protease family)